MDKLFLLDAYALIYRSYYAFMKNPRINSKGLNTSCIMGFCNTLNEILTKEKPTHIGVAFDHGKTFRHEAFPAYKAQREETPEDIKLSVPIIKNILDAYHIPILQVDGFEADDVIGTLATKAGEKGVQQIGLSLLPAMRAKKADNPARDSSSLYRSFYHSIKGIPLSFDRISILIRQSARCS